MTVDWSNTVIYLLRANDPLLKEFYVGKSGNFTERQTKHKCRSNNNKNSSEKEYHFPVYKFIRENGGFDDWHFEILETANLEDEDEAANLERNWIEKLKPSLNIQLPAQTTEERAENNRECSRIRQRKKMEDPEYRKKQYESNKKRKEDPELKKKDAARALEKITCICGAIHNRKGKSQHLDSLKHKAFLKNNPQET